jgi:hypothetical protein
MPTYKPLPENSKVMDVLCCLVLKINRVKEMMNVLKQPHSTVSEKLRFLIKNKVVKKDKWEFEVNWDVLIKLLKDITELQLRIAIGKEYKKYLELFDNERLKGIMKAYASMIVVQQVKPKRMLLQIRKPKSLENMMWMYILGMSQTSDDELRKYDKDFVWLKKRFEGFSDEKLLFVTSEE